MAAAQRACSAGSSSKAASAWAVACGLASGVTKPAGPSRGDSSARPSMMSAQEPTLVATLGTPAAPASSSTSGCASLTLVSTTTSIWPR